MPEFNTTPEVLSFLILAAKKYSNYQSIGNGARLNIAIENAERHMSELKTQAK